jgi:hypothetical protein
MRGRCRGTSRREWSGIALRKRGIRVEAAVREAGQVSAAAEALRDSNDREIFSISKGPGDSIVFRTSFRERVTSGGGLFASDADVLLCVQYTVEPDIRSRSWLLVERRPLICVFAALEAWTWH